MEKRRVVVTGLGIVAPVGIGVTEAWSNIVAGKSGITRITRFDPSGLGSQIAGEVKGFDVTRYLPRSEEHTSELQSQSNLVCRLLLEKKKRTSCRGLRHGRLSA